MTAGRIAPTSRRVIPSPGSRLVDDGGNIDDAWYGFIQALYNRTGGPIGNGLSAGMVSPDLSALQSDVAALLTATTDLPSVRLALTALTVGLADVQTMAAVQADPDPAPPMPDLSDLYTLALTLPDDAAPPVAADPLALAILASD